MSAVWCCEGSVQWDFRGCFFCFFAENNELKDTKNAAIFFPSFPPFVPSYLLVPHLGISPLVGSLSAASLPEVNKAVCIITSSQSDRWAGVCLVCANVTLLYCR